MKRGFKKVCLSDNDEMIISKYRQYVRLLYFVTFNRIKELIKPR